MVQTPPSTSQHTMQAALFLQPDSMALRRVPVPQPSGGEALLRVLACAVCGTDLRILSGGKTRGVQPPRVLGHEVCGELVSLGPDVDPQLGLAAGERVVVAPGIPCGRCRLCQLGRDNMCQAREAIGYRYHGGFAEYLLVPARLVAMGGLLPVADHLTAAEAALTEPLACCVNGQRHTPVQLGDVVLIAGAGPIGLMHLLLSRQAGAAQVLVSEPAAARRTLAGELGASRAVDPTREDVVAAVHEATAGLGADVVILAIGVPALVNQALTAARPGGRVNLFAGYAGRGEAEIAANTIHYGELVVTGTSGSTREDLRVALALLESGQINVAPLVSHRFPLDQIHQAFETTRSGAGLRVIVAP